MGPPWQVCWGWEGVFVLCAGVTVRVCLCRCVRYHLPDQGSTTSCERKNEFAAKAGSKTEALLKKGER